jgi:hypothetical protein
VHIAHSVYISLLVLSYANDEAAFFADYAAAHKKLSELGSKFSPAGGIRI